MRTRGALILAVLISAAFHGGVVIVPGWQLPEMISAPPPLEARLLQVPASVPQPAASEKRKRTIAKPEAKPAPSPEPVQQAVLPPIEEPLPAESLRAREASPESAPAAELAASEAQQTEAQQRDGGQSEALGMPALGGTQANLITSPGTAIADWAGEGCVKYVLSVQYGILSGEFGQARQCWSHDERRYSATLKGQAAVLFKQFSLEQSSTGRLLNGVLVSDVFRETFDGRAYDTLFDVAGAALKQDRNGESREYVTNGLALDMLALMHFMALQPDDAPAFDVFVVATRGTVSRVTVMQHATQPVDLPIGPTIARQFHAEARNGELKIDVWIGKTLSNAPVRFRIDNKGDVFDFHATEVTLNGQSVVRRPEPPPPHPASE